METPGEPAANLGQTLEWLRKELVSLFFRLVISPCISRGFWSHTHSSQDLTGYDRGFGLKFEPCRHPSWGSHTEYNGVRRYWESGS